MVLGERSGLGPFLSSVCAAAVPEEACWKVSVGDGGENTLDAFKRVSAGVSCSVPCRASSWAVEGPSVTRALRERIAALLDTEVRVPAQHWFGVLSNIGTGTTDTLEGRGGGVQRFLG